MKRWIRGILVEIGFKDTLKTARFDLSKFKARRQTGSMYKAYVQRNGTPSKFHFGCGNRIVAGWLNSDLAKSDVNIDLSTARLPFASGSLQHACAQHFIEHLNLTEELKPLLEELHRCLRADGEIWLSCPDIEKICNSYMYDKCQTLIEDRQKRLKRYDTRGYPPSYFMNDVFIQQGEHKNLFDFELLRYLLEMSGFSEISRIDESTFLQKFKEFPRRNDDAQTLYVTAKKR